MRIAVFLILFISSLAYAESQPKALVDRNTGQVISWGYADFKPTADQIVIENITIKPDVSDGLKYENGSIISAPEYASKKTKTLEERVIALEKKVGI